MGVHCYFAFTKIKYFVVSSKSFTPLSCNFYLFYSLYMGRQFVYVKIIQAIMQALSYNNPCLLIYGM